MDITTTRFGTVTIDDEDVLTFVDGLIGMEDCRRWALLADAQNSALGWLQSLDRPEVALAVVCPRRFVADYRVRVARRDVEPLGLVRRDGCPGAGDRQPSRRFAGAESQSAAGGPCGDAAGPADRGQRQPLGAAPA